MCICKQWIPSGDDCSDSECKTRCDKQWHKDKMQWLHQSNGYEKISDSDNIGSNDHHVDTCACVWQGCDKYTAKINDVIGCHINRI